MIRSKNLFSIYCTLKIAEVNNQVKIRWLIKMLNTWFELKTPFMVCSKNKPEYALD